MDARRPAGVAATLGGFVGLFCESLSKPSMSAGRGRCWTSEGAAVAPPGGYYSRSLAVQVFEIGVMDPTKPWSGPVARPWQRGALHVELEGAFGPEVFDGVGEGVWLGPRAILKVPGFSGKLTLRLSAPRPTPSRTRVRVGRSWVIGPIDLTPEPTDVTLDLLQEPDRPAFHEIEIVSAPYLPASDGSGDLRELGAVLSWLEFEPAAKDLDGLDGGP